MVDHEPPVSAQPRTVRRVAKPIAAIGISVLLLALTMTVGVTVGLSHGAPGAYTCEPYCGGGGGGSEPVSALLFASAPSGVSAQTACQSYPADQCLSSFATTYTTPLLNPSNDEFSTYFSDLASGGTGSYSYYWAWPGGSGWVSGSEAPTYEFTKIATYTVSTEISSSGYSSVTISMTIDVVAGSPPSGSGASYSVGLLGWGISLNEQLTQWAVKVLAGGAAVAGVAAAIGAFFGGIPGAVAGLVAAILAGYAEWITLADEGSGVCFYAYYLEPTVPLVSANPCPSET